MPYLPIVYASLGTAEQGATAKEIQQRSGLRVGEVARGLQALADLGAVREVGERYFAPTAHVNLPHLRESGVYGAYYRELLKRASRHAEQQLRSPQALHFSSALSVSSQELPRFKEELRALLTRFVDQAEKGDGDRVVSIACSLF